MSVLIYSSICNYSSPKFCPLGLFYQEHTFLHIHPHCPTSYPISFGPNLTSLTSGLISSLTSSKSHSSLLSRLGTLVLVFLIHPSIHSFIHSIKTYYKGSIIKWLSTKTHTRPNFFSPLTAIEAYRSYLSFIYLSFSVKWEILCT